MRQGCTAYGVGGEMAFRVGLEPTPISLTGRRSYQLSYRNIEAARAPRGQAAGTRCGDCVNKRRTALRGSAYTNFTRDRLWCLYR